MPLVIRSYEARESFTSVSEIIEFQSYTRTPEKASPPAPVPKTTTTETVQAEDIEQKALTIPDKKSDYSLSTFFTQKNLKSTWGKIAASISAISMATVIEALVGAVLKETFCRGIDYFFDTNFLEATQDFIEQHLDFWKTAAAIAGPVLVGIGLIALYIAYHAEKKHVQDQKQSDDQRSLLDTSNPAS